MNEYDQRQYKLMVDCLLDYEQEQIPLGQLLDNLDALLAVLERARDAWKRRFKSEWWILEQIYARGLDRNEGALRLGGEDKALMVEALTKMKVLLREVCPSTDFEGA